MDRPALLLTRPAQSARDFIDSLDPAALRDVTVCISPLLRIVRTGVEPDLDGYRGAIFTSSNGVDMAPRGEGRVAVCVGDRTATAAQGQGWDVRQLAQTADALVALLVAAPVEGPLLHIAGQHRRGDIAGRLNAAGLRTDEAIVYDQQLEPLTDAARALLAADRPVLVPLFSPRTAQQFMSGTQDLGGVTIVAISEAVAAEVDHDRIGTMYIAQAPTSKAMQQAVEMLLRQDSLP